MTARKVPPASVPVWNFPPGHFTAPCRAWWGPDWKPYGDWGRNDVLAREAAVRGRESQLAAGHTGAIKGISKASADSIARYAEQARKARK